MKKSKILKILGIGVIVILAGMLIKDFVLYELLKMNYKLEIVGSDFIKVTHVAIEQYNDKQLKSELEIPKEIYGIEVVKINDGAFLGCDSLKSISIPNTIKYIEEGALDGCLNLQSIEVANDNEYYSSEDGILFNKEKTELIKCPESIQLTNYTIPDTVTKISASAFWGCENLESITIPNSVTSIEECTFELCSNLKNVKITDNITSIGREVFHGTKIENIEIPASVTNIEADAFILCASLEKIEVDSNNKNYSSQDGILFNKDKSKLIFCPQNIKVTTYNIPYSVINIEDDAFLYCNNLENINISSNVKNIGNVVFYGCKSLKNININSDNKNYSSENGILFNKEKTKLVKCPSGIEVTDYTIPDGVISIENNAFEECENMRNVTLPESLKFIGDEAFRFCYNLESVTVSEQITSVGARAFWGCENLDNSIILENATNIGENAFYGTKNFKTKWNEPWILSIIIFVVFCIIFIKKVIKKSKDNKKIEL